MSDKSLDQLIETLKSEAIHSADKKSEKILNEAREKAEMILKSAEEKRRQIISDAETEAEDIVKKGESALRQAARDLHLAVRNELIRVFHAALQKEIRQEFKPDLIRSAIVQVVENIGSDVELELPKQFEQELAEFVRERVQGMDKLISVTTDDSLLDRISVSNTEEGWRYEISPEEVADLLQAHLTDNWIRILKKKDHA